jgi:hypothetical protein
MKQKTPLQALTLIALTVGTLGFPQDLASVQYHNTAQADALVNAAGAAFNPFERFLRAEIDAIYKGDYRNAFVNKNPQLFLKYIPDDFVSENVEGQKFNAAGLRQFFPTQFPNMVRTIEHNVSIEDVDVISPTKLSAVVTLNTLIEYKGAAGNYLVYTLGTYRDVWEKRGGQWFEVEGNQLRNQTISFRRP